MTPPVPSRLHVDTTGSWTWCETNFWVFSSNVLIVRDIFVSGENLSTRPDIRHVESELESCVTIRQPPRIATIGSDWCTWSAADQGVPPFRPRTPKTPRIWTFQDQIKNPENLNENDWKLRKLQHFGFLIFLAKKIQAGGGNDLAL